MGLVGFSSTQGEAAGALAFDRLWDPVKKCRFPGGQQEPGSLVPSGPRAPSAVRTARVLAWGDGFHGG